MTDEFKKGLMTGLSLQNSIILGGGTMNYSTEEQIVGMWIDGKPLYRRFFKSNYTANEIVTNNGLSWSNDSNTRRFTLYNQDIINELYDLPAEINIVKEDSYISSDNITYSFLYHNPAESLQWNTKSVLLPGTLVILIGKGMFTGYSNRYYGFLIEYTKTTD